MTRSPRPGPRTPAARRWAARLLAAAVGLGPAAGGAAAGSASFTKTAGGPYVWSDTANWSPAVVPNGTADVATFGADPTAAVTVTLDGSYTVNRLVFSQSAAAAGAYTIAGSNALTLGGTTPTITVTNAGATANISAALAGTAGLTFTGAGTLVLSGVNTYTGATAIQGGTVQLAGGDNRLAPASVMAATAVPGTVVTLGSGTASGVLVLGSGGTGVGQILGGLATTGTGAANAVVGGASTVSTLTLSLPKSGGAYTYAGVLGGAGANQNNLALVLTSNVSVTNGAGANTNSSTVTLSGAASNTLTGGITVNAGYLNLGKTGGAVAVPGNLTIGDVNTALASRTFPNVNGTVANQFGSASVVSFYSGTAAFSSALLGLSANQTVAGLSTPEVLLATPVYGTASVVQSNTGTQTITVNTTSDYTYDGIVRNNGGVLNLVKTGAGKQTLMSTNTLVGLTFTGSVTINGGNLTLSVPTANGVKAITGLGASGIANNATLGLDVATGLSATLSKVVSGTGAVLKTGIGTVILSGANTYSGATTVSAGTLTLNATGAIPSSATVAVASGATFDVSAVTGGFTLGGSTAQTLRGAGTVVGPLTAGASGTVRAGDPAVNGGAGTLAVTGAVTFSASGTLGVKIIAPGPAYTTTLGSSSTTGPANNNLLAVSGTLTVPASGLVLAVDGTGVAFDTGGTTYSYRIATSGGLGGVTAGNDMAGVTFQPTGFTATNFVLTTDTGGAVYLNFTPTSTSVPEPAGLLAAGAVAVGLLRVGRRRRTAAPGTGAVPAA